MQAYLSTSWNYGIAFGELVSSSLMVFFLFSFEYFINTKTSNNLIKSLFVRPFVFVLSGLISIVFGWIIGSMISGDGFGLSMISPLFATLQAFRYWKFNALWFIICFQIIGTIVGLGMFLLYVKVFSSRLSLSAFRKNNIDAFLINPSKTLYKSLLFCPLLVFAFLLIPELDHTSYGTSVFLNTFLLLTVLFVLAFLTQKSNFFIFSPFISLIQIFLICFDNKKVLKKALTNFTIEFSLQVVFAIGAIAMVISLDRMTNWY